MGIKKKKIKNYQFKTQLKSLIFSFSFSCNFVISFIKIFTFSSSFNSFKGIFKVIISIFLNALGGIKLSNKCFFLNSDVKFIFFSLNSYNSNLFSYVSSGNVLFIVALIYKEFFFFFF